MEQKVPAVSLATDLAHLDLQAVYNQSNITVNA